MPLHIDYRPSKIEEVFGNDAVKDSLLSVLNREKDFPRAFLFHGPSGTGKTTFARIIGNMLDVKGQDFMEYNTAEARGIDTVREIDQNCRYAPLDGKFKIYLLDEVHRGTLDFQSSLLKLLEDSPNHVIFILCTTEPEKVLKTIRTRCMMFQTKSLLNHQVESLLDWVLKSEGIEDYPESVKEQIVSVSEGCPRQALVLLDSVIDIVDEKKALEAVQDFQSSEATVIDICRLLVANEKGKWKKMSELIKRIDMEPESVRYAILGYFTKILMSGSNDKVADMMEIFFENWMYSKKAGMVWALYQASKFN